MTEENFSNGAKNNIELCERYVKEFSLYCMAMTWHVHMTIFCTIHFRLNLILLINFRKFDFVSSSELSSKFPSVSLRNLQFEKIAAGEHQPVKNSPDTSDSDKITGWEILEPDRTVKVKQMKSSLSAEEDMSGLVMLIMVAFHKG